MRQRVHYMLLLYVSVSEWRGRSISQRAYELVRRLLGAVSYGQRAEHAVESKPVASLCMRAKGLHNAHVTHGVPVRKALASPVPV